MAKRAPSPEISLFPFLSILVCLIGALVLLIVILTIAQGSAAAARDPGEFARATAAAALRRQQETLQAGLLARTRERDEQTAALRARDPVAAELARLREDLARAGQTAAPDPETLRRKLNELRAQISALEKERPPITHAIERLKAELAARRKPDTTPPPLVVQPGGSGQTAGTRLVFAEANAAGLTLLRKEGPLRVPSGAIGTDGAYNAFLQELKRESRSALIFLVREDGLTAYTRGAGWAESQYDLRTGKLPLPGKGRIDLSHFGIRE